MATSPVYSTRALSSLFIAAAAGIALWMLLPAITGSSFNGSGGGDNAALPASLKVDGTVSTESTDGVVTRLVVPLAVRGGNGIELGGDFRMRAETFMSDSASAAVPATYAIEWLSGNGDTMLEPGEQAVLTVDLPAPSSVHPENPLRLVLKPTVGVNLVIEDVLN
jgi:hypothetical protein